jgi:hypothetical protein
MKEEPMSKYADKQFWIDTFDRAVATFAQSIAGVLVVDKVSIFTVDWQGALGLALAITGASVLTSIAFRGNKSDAAE